jgi:hypothetical protein
MPALAAAQRLRGDAEAIAMARTLIDRMGGHTVWGRATTLHVIEEVHRPDVRLPYRSESWRSFTEPSIWGRSQSSEIDRGFARTRTGGWTADGAAIRMLSDLEHRRWLGYWPRNIYVMYHRLAVEDSTLWLVRRAGRRFAALDARTAENLGEFEVSLAGDLVRWSTAFATENEEWIYGPLTAFGPIRMPAWGARLGDGYRFSYREVTLSETPPPISFDPPRR